ncbi:hypothetical protein MAPG_09323 [Magnaporthiopsis poae ATCC 64411]|uniref:Uncharacterized protein n=1 Tax=Magnaporthiopsis poae (strain ATCC 64411 / 73-15) TaxID=644358 RepID=A0A0C4E9M7_MAGP6|nr:hypothetical protein MAPG_09323 [Magnaporthiopsis poae ATCC 64411]
MQKSRDQAIRTWQPANRAVGGGGGRLGNRVRFLSDWAGNRIEKAVRTRAKTRHRSVSAVEEHRMGLSAAKTGGGSCLRRGYSCEGALEAGVGSSLGFQGSAGFVSGGGGFEENKKQNTQRATGRKWRDDWGSTAGDTLRRNGRQGPARTGTAWLAPGIELADSLVRDLARWAVESGTFFQPSSSPAFPPAVPPPLQFQIDIGDWAYPGYRHTHE